MVGAGAVMSVGGWESAWCRYTNNSRKVRPTLAGYGGRGASSCAFSLLSVAAVLCIIPPALRTRPYPPCITHAALVACEALHRPPCIIHAALAACASLLWLAGVLDTAAAALHSVPFLCSPLPRFSALSPCITHAALVACEALHRPPCIIHAALVACEAIAPVASQKSYLQRCPQSCIV